METLVEPCIKGCISFGLCLFAQPLLSFARPLRVLYFWLLLLLLPD